MSLFGLSSNPWKSFGGYAEEVLGIDDVQDGYRQAIEAYSKQFKPAKKDISPWVEWGKTQGRDAVTRLQDDPSSIAELPYYNFIMDQGLGAIERQKGAKGKFFSGETQHDIIDYASGVASTTYGDEWARRMKIAEMGYGASSTMAGMRMQYGSDIASLYASQGRDVGGMKYQWGTNERKYMHDFGMSAWNSFTSGGMGGGGGGGGGG